MKRIFVRRPSHPGRLMLGLWLVLWGVFQLVPSLSSPGAQMLLGLLAVAAGVMTVLEK